MSSFNFNRFSILTENLFRKFFALICLFFVVSSYTANIIALLQSTTKSISTLEDVLNSDMEVAVQDTPFNREFIPSITGDAQIRLYHAKIAPPGEDPKFVNLTYGIDKVRQVNDLNIPPVDHSINSELHVLDPPMTKLLRSRDFSHFMSTWAVATVESNIHFWKTKNVVSLKYHFHT